MDDVVEKDLYGILGVAKTASNKEIQRAYYKLAKQLHPDKNPGDDGAAMKFRDVSESYEILTDAEKKAVYDQYGYQGLKDMDMPKSSHGSAQETFEEFFGNENPFQDFKFFEMENPFSKLKKPSGDTTKLPCSLEELFFGCVKKLELHSDQHSPKHLTVHVLPGSKNGTKMTHGDMIFEVQELPHNIYKREGTNLLYTANIDLGDAVASEKSFRLKVPTIEGGSRDIAFDGGVVTPGSKKIIPNGGMPLSKTPSIRGNLIITFDVRFPTALTDPQRTLLRKVLKSANYN